MWRLCAPSTAQSPKKHTAIDGAALRNDSLEVVREFVKNARPILDSLTALHFARGRISDLDKQVRRVKTQRDSAAMGQIACQNELIDTIEKLHKARDDTANQRQKRRRYQAEAWAWRITVVAGLVIFLRPF